MKNLEAINPYIIEIAQKLWSGHASLMVGSGFSKNALKSDPSKKNFPNWQELGDIFYEKVYGKRPDPSYRYLNILKLAQEVETAFGRPVLNEILIENIPDKDHIPSSLHVSLMDLPWSDVFTTNYDTLLERSCESVISQKYDVIVNQEDLVYSKRPRIVKLHGSFPSERPLIVSENDYRQYPRSFAPFINTVQQALLENALCLIGFSADDPNFLQWIGWIHDNLGRENAPIIYMIGLFHQTDVQRKLLESRNITLVDLSGYTDISGSHFSAFSAFFKDIRALKKRDVLSWPHHSKFREIKIESINEILSGWSTDRLDYPNWVITPHDRRGILWMFTSRHADESEIISELADFQDLKYCSELNWRLEKCLFPLTDNLQSDFQRVFDKYNPFPTELNQQTGLWPKDINGSEYSKMVSKQDWIDIGFALLKSYRESGQIEKWEQHHLVFKSISIHFTAEDTAKFHFETAMQSVTNHDFKKLKLDIGAWPANENLPFWEAKRAGMLIELGRNGEAIKLLEDSLYFIRKLLNLHSISDDLGLISQESYIIYLLKYYIINIDFNRSFDEETNSRDRERWNDLAKFKCDPWDERQYFDQALKFEYEPPKEKIINQSFDLGVINQTIRLSSEDDQWMGYMFIRFLEEVYFPTGLRHGNINIKTMTGALKRVAVQSPFLAISAMIRYGEGKLIENILERDLVGRLSISEVDKRIKRHIEIFNDLLPEIDTNAVANAFILNSPEILSRLCPKSSHDSKKSIYKLIFDIYIRRIVTRHIGILLKRLDKASDPEIKVEVIGSFLSLPILNYSTHEDRQNFPDPFYFLGLEIEDVTSIKTSIPDWQISRLLEEADCKSPNRVNALRRLYFLYRLKLLQDDQSLLLEKVTWACTDKSGFPLKMLFRRSFHLTFSLHSDVLIKFKDYVLHGYFDFEDSTFEPKIEEAHNIFEEITGGSKKENNENGIVWTADELNIILNNCLQWWNHDKNELRDRKDHGGILGAFDNNSLYETRYRSMIDMLYVLFRFQGNNIDLKDHLQIFRQIVLDMASFSIPVLKLKSIWVELFFDDHIQYYDALEQGVTSNNEYLQVDAFIGIKTFLIISISRHEFKDFNRRLINLLIQPMKWNVVPQMRHSLTVLSDLGEVDIFSEVEELKIFVLEFLQKSYSKNKEGNESVTTDKLVYLQKTIELAMIMSRTFSKRGEQIPQILLDWRSFLEENIQFTDVFTTKSWPMHP